MSGCEKLQERKEATIDTAKRVPEQKIAENQVHSKINGDCSKGGVKSLASLSDKAVSLVLAYDSATSSESASLKADHTDKRNSVVAVATINTAKRVQVRKTVESKVHSKVNKGCLKGGARTLTSASDKAASLESASDNATPSESASLKADHSDNNSSVMALATSNTAKRVKVRKTVESKVHSKVDKGCLKGGARTLTSASDKAASLESASDNLTSSESASLKANHSDKCSSVIAICSDEQIFNNELFEPVDAETVDSEPIMPLDDLAVCTITETVDTKLCASTEKNKRLWEETDSILEKEGSTTLNLLTEKHDAMESVKVSGSGDATEKKPDRKGSITLLMQSIDHVLSDISEVVTLERPVVHFELGYVGTFDCIAKYR